MTEEDLIGKTFYYLTVIEKYKTKSKLRCRCICGKELDVLKSNLLKGNTKSCGCRRYRKPPSMRKKYPTLYSRWKAMKTRCYNKNFQEYDRYGGRGIAVCDEWKNNFESFATWALDNGFLKELTLERIDVDKGYSPDNCTWILFAEQQRNKTNNVYIKADEECKLSVDWMKEFNLNKSIAYYDVVNLVRRKYPYSQVSVIFKPLMANTESQP